MSDVKENIREILDSIDDESFLEAVYEILQNKQSQKDGKIWESLTPAQRESVLSASEETSDPKKQTSHKEMTERNKKWLNK